MRKAPRNLGQLSMRSYKSFTRVAHFASKLGMSRLMDLLVRHILVSIWPSALTFSVNIFPLKSLPAILHTIQYISMTVFQLGKMHAV
jgi:hypothetical protein